MAQKHDSSIDQLDGKLREALAALEGCEDLIIAAKLDPHSNIRRMGEALWALFGVRQDIFRVRPDLKPDHLKD